MSRLEWDKAGEHFYETGVDRGVLYVYDKATSSYKKGVAWNGLTTVAEKPTGADATAKYADNIKYLNLIAAEDLEASVEAFTYPKEFGECDGSTNIGLGAYIGQQQRATFALCYRTRLGNELAGDSLGYKLHILYGCSAAPSEKSYETVNDSPDAITFSWEIKTVPVNVTGHQPTAQIILDSREFVGEKANVLKEIEDMLYGTESAEPTLMMPNDILAKVTA